MLLYEHPLSSYAQKIKIALREKGVSFETELPESFGTGRNDGPFAAANPRAEVPVLIALRRVGKYVSELALHKSTDQPVGFVRGLLAIEDANGHGALGIRPGPGVIHSQEP